MTHPLPQRATAEALGTALLVCTVVGSGIMAQTLSEDVGLQLLGNTIPTGAILVVLITLFGPISGAHFNPAVTLIFRLRKELPTSETGVYIGAQIIGGILGAWAAHVMFEQELLQFSQNMRSGPAQWFSEGIATFGLLLTILCGLRANAAAIPWLVGLYITAAYWFTASTSFANPAVAIARGFTDTFSGIRPIDVPLFITAQLVGAVLAMIFVRWLWQERRDA